MRKGLTTCSWLASKIRNNSTDLSVLDASWYLPPMNRNAKEEFNQRRIQGAKFFDLDNSFSAPSPFPHTLPDPESFWKQVGALGIEKNDAIVAYDGMGIFSAARCWWMFKIMGWDSDKLFVLDGGFNRFAKEFPDLIDYETPSPITKTMEYNSSDYHFRNDLFRSIEQIEENLDTKKEMVVDARPKGRFDGTAPEPRPNIPSGHMPNSVSVPFTSVIDSNGCLKNTNEIQEIYLNQGIDISKEGTPIISSCGSGVSAAVLDLALTATDTPRLHSLFDGSWSEYADQSEKQRPIITNK